MRFKKGFTPIIVIVLVVIAGIAFYFIGKNSSNSQITQATPTPEAIVEDEMDDWDTYTNTEYGYSLKHPSSYLTEEQKDLGENRMRTIFKDNNSEVSSFSLYVSPNTGGLPQFPYDQPITGDTFVNGEAAVYVELPNGHADGLAKPIPFIAVYTIHNTFLYQFNFFDVSSIDNELASQILSTFEFTK